MNTAERYYLTDHLEKAIAREKRNGDKLAEEIAKIEVQDSPYALGRYREASKNHGYVLGLMEAQSIIRGLS